MTFNITENQLTNAIFFDIATDAPGTSTVAEARAQARLMLAAPQLLKACRHTLDVLAAIEAEHSAVMIADAISIIEPCKAAIAAAEGERT